MIKNMDNLKLTCNVLSICDFDQLSCIELVYNTSEM